MKAIDDIAKELNDFIANIIITQERDSYHDEVSIFSLIKIATNLNLKELDNTDSMPQQKLYPPQEQAEPLIDVLDSEKSVKIVALIHNVKKDDVNFNAGYGVIDLEIRKGGQTYHKQIPCSVKPSNVIVKSTTYNNSVMEIIFDKV